MTMIVQQGVPPESIDLFCKRANRVTLSQVVENIVIRESLCKEGETRRIRFIIDINFYPKEEYQEEHGLEPSDILSSFQYRFPVGLKKEIAVELKKLDADMKNQIAQLGIGKKVSSKDVEGEGGEDDEGPVKVRGEDEESVGDADAEDEKRARQKKQQATYESGSEDEEVEDLAEYDDDAIEAEYAGGDLGPDSTDAVTKKSKSSLKTLLTEASEGFQRHLQQCTSFDFDASKCSFTLEVFVAPYYFNSRS
jgi:DNA-directed RNA polymerase I subunit RPA1